MDIEYDNVLDEKEQRRVPDTGPYSDFIVILISIIAVELTIRWNHITGVDTLNSTSQILPFVLGVGLFFYAFYVLFRGDQEKNRTSEDPITTELRRVERVSP